MRPASSGQRPVRAVAAGDGGADHGGYLNDLNSQNKNTVCKVRSLNSGFAAAGLAQPMSR